MSQARVKTPGIAVAAFAVVAAATIVLAGAARADVAFRKKAPAASGASSEIAPSGGEEEAAAAPPAAAAAVADTEAPPADTEAAPPPKTEYVPQADDTDRPTDPALLDQQKTDAQLAAKAKAKEEPPLYAKWQFWAITGGVLVGLAAAIIGSIKIAHEVNGGDVRPCGMAFSGGCYGEGH